MSLLEDNASDDESKKNYMKNNINCNNVKNDSFNELLNSSSYKNTITHDPKFKKLPTINPSSKIVPINKESYDRQIAYERERMDLMTEELQDYENKYRGTSLLEEHQKKLAKDKHKGGEASSRPFDREKDMNVGRIDSKRALSIMNDQKGLKGRFEAREKYMGF
jgi:hypothetical protein